MPMTTNKIFVESASVDDGTDDEELSSSTRVGGSFGVDYGALPLPEYDRWFDAIRNDDSDEVDVTLTVCDDPAELRRLVDGRFRFYDIGAVRNVDVKNCSFTHPLTLAIAYGALRVVDVLLQQGGVRADEVIEAGGNNVVHCLVCLAFYDAFLEDDAVRTYEFLCRRLTSEQLERLLLAENANGLRPLEFAVQQGTLKLMSAMFETNGVYVKRQV